MCQQQLNALKRLLRNERQTERREARDNEIARATQTSADCTTPTLRQSLHLSETKPLRLPPSSSDPDTRYERTRLIKSPSTNVMERSKPHAFTFTQAAVYVERKPGARRHPRASEAWDSGLDVFTHLSPDSANDNDSAGFSSAPTHRLNDASTGRKTKRAVDAALSQLKVTEQKRS
ncbi:hypothetical protein DPX16_14355 [Anabarilius grahami]|uniref:Uncharacterized protein n=1 Tax=Anabarilius grahami TaxID=495550 RepID=A0A3N0XLX7_ANAGA|nr:hypothetical protein DPX16_14355 [Anabarilius grahami]